MEHFSRRVRMRDKSMLGETDRDTNMDVDVDVDVDTDTDTDTDMEADAARTHGLSLPPHGCGLCSVSQVQATRRGRPVVIVVVVVAAVVVVVGGVVGGVVVVPTGGGGGARVPLSMFSHSLASIPRAKSKV